MATFIVLDKDTLSHQLGFDAIASPEEANNSSPEPADAVITDVECSAAAVTPSPDEAEANNPPENYQTPAFDHVLAKVQKKFFLMDTDSTPLYGEYERLKARDRNGAAKPLKLSKAANGLLRMRRYVRKKYPGVDDLAITRAFMLDPGTRMFQGTEFHPKKTTRGYLNLYLGPVIKPMAGECEEIKRFMFEVICDNDPESYEYLFKYLAHTYQRPEEKPGGFIVLISGQGTGKGTFCRIIQEIWRPTYVQVNKAEMVVGRFNTVLERALWVVMDEALFCGNRQETDRLKSLVTELEIVIEAKYQPSRTIRSHHRFVMTTNAVHAKHTEYDDRRDLTLRVSERYKGDFAYWNRLKEHINPSSLAAFFVHELATEDLTEFNVRKVPSTAEKLRQKIMSLGPIESYWYQCLEDGSIDGSSGWPAFVKSEDLLDGVLAHWGRFHKKPLIRDVIQTLRLLCPSVKQGQQGTTPNRHRGLELPPLLQARGEFETWIGGKIVW